MDDRDLRDLAVQASEGNLDAVEALIRGFHGHLFSFLHLLRVPTMDIEDVAQTVVIQTYQNLEDYRSAQPFLPFLRGVARHVAANYWRTRRRDSRKAEGFLAFIERRLSAGGVAADLEIPVEKLRRCIDRLLPRQRDLVLLRYEQGLDSDAIGRRLGLHAAAVRQTLTRIRRVLRSCIQGSEVAE
jgi:RNA polymerase sigma-70 factor (ECF subfamily)